MAYSFSQLEGLWIQAGGNPGMAPIMAAIALAESGGNPNSTGGVGEKGLWQINPSAWGNLATYDPLGNAKAAVYVLAHQGLGAWTTYTNGAYKQFLQSGVAPSGAPATASTAAATGGGGSGIFGVIDGIGKTIGGLISGPVSIAEGVSSIAHDLGVVAGTLNTILNDALWLFKPSHWVRIFAGVLGIGMLLPGVYLLGKAGKGEGDISLALGILLTVGAGLLLFVAFHSLPDDVRSFKDFLGYLASEVRSNSPATTTPIADQGLAQATISPVNR